MSEKYRLIKHNENLAEIGNDRGVGLLFLVDEDCERKLGIIVDCLNEKQSTIQSLEEENNRLRKKIFNGLFDNCTLENENDISHLQYVFALCKLLVDDAMEEVENENIEYAVETAEECIYQFESRMKHFNQDKNGEKRVF